MWFGTGIALLAWEQISGLPQSVGCKDGWIVWKSSSSTTSSPTSLTIFPLPALTGNNIHLLHLLPGRLYPLYLNIIPADLLSGYPAPAIACMRVELTCSITPAPTQTVILTAKSSIVPLLRSLLHLPCQHLLLFVFSHPRIRLSLHRTAIHIKGIGAWINLSSRISSDSSKCYLGNISVPEIWQTKPWSKNLDNTKWCQLSEGVLLTDTFVDRSLSQT